MLRSLKELEDYAIHGTDGEVGDWHMARAAQGVDLSGSRCISACAVAVRIPPPVRRYAASRQTF